MALLAAKLRIFHLQKTEKGNYTTSQGTGRTPLANISGSLGDRTAASWHQDAGRANAALPSLLQKHNHKFAIEPKMSDSAYLKLDPSIDLTHVFTLRNYRQLGTANTLSYNEKFYTLVQPASLRLDTKTTVEVRETLTGDVLLWHQGQPWALKETQKPSMSGSKKASSASPRKPAQNHPWKTPYDTTKNKLTTKNSAFQDAMYSQHNSYAEVTLKTRLTAQHLEQAVIELAAPGSEPMLYLHELPSFYNRTVSFT
ncbi:hypothetical protein ABEX25_27500 [Paenibacillus thiaminolyticus]